MDGDPSLLLLYPPTAPGIPWPHAARGRAADAHNGCSARYSVLQFGVRAQALDGQVEKRPHLLRCMTALAVQQVDG